MLILTKYIIKTLFLSILFVSVAWVLIFSIFDFLADSSNIGTKDYSLLDSLYVLLLNSPLLIYKRLIVIMLIGVILALGHLASTSQLIVARSIGVSILKIATIVITSTMFLYLAIASIGETIAPKLAEYSIHYKAKKLGKTEIKHLQQETWIKDKNLIINMEKNYDGKNFGGVSIFNITNNKLVSSTWADRMVIDDNIAILDTANNYKIIGDDLEFYKQNNQKINILFDDKFLTTLQKNPLDLSIIDIYQQVSFLNANNLNGGIFKIELYKRILKPFILITTILFAMLFIFGSMRNASIGKKLFLGIVISIVLELYLRVAGALVLKFDYNYFLLVATPIILFFIIVFRFLWVKNN